MYQENNWVGVKMGDVNFDSDYLIRTTSRSANEVYPIVLEESISGDGRVQLTVKMSEMIRLSGLQLALDLGDYRDWKLQNPGLNLTDDNWSIDNNHLKLSWVSQGHERSFDRDEVLFYIDFAAPMEQFDPTSITLGTGALKSEVYAPDLSTIDIGLHYRQLSGDLEHTVYPNPVDQFQVFEFYSPMAQEAVISIHSIGGKEIESFEVDLAKGYTKYHQNLGESYHSGMYVYQIRTQSKVVTGRFEVIR